MKKTNNWVAIWGEIEKIVNGISFKGGMEPSTNTPIPAIGNLLTDITFSGGAISADIIFRNDDEHNACEIMLYYDPQTGNMVTAGIGSTQREMFAIRSFVNDPTSGGGWSYHAVKGKRDIKIGHKYHLEVKVKASSIRLFVDGVEVCSTVVPFTIPRSQIGIWCLSDEGDIEITNYTVLPERPVVFVVMQFSEPYNQLYDEVIKPLCDEFTLKAVRADEKYGPGMIIADIEKDIRDSKIVLADITPLNANVYYEVGFAHALGKPTILMAENLEKLPFDVSPFRVLVYENTIAGKKKVEESLRKHIKAIMENL